MTEFDHTTQIFKVGDKVSLQDGGIAPFEVTMIEATVGGWRYRVWSDIWGGTWAFGDELSKVEE